MPKQKRALSGIDPNIPAPGEPNSGKRTKLTAETSSADNAASNAQSNGRKEINDSKPTYIALPRPVWDIEAEARDKQEDDDDDDDDDESKSTGAQDVEAPEILQKYHGLGEQVGNRDQDMHKVYMYSNFTAYGVNEVIDNWLKDFNKEVSRRPISPYAVWAELEAVSYFLQLDYTYIWFSGDDCHGFAETLAVIGKALLTGIHVLQTNQLFKPYDPEEGSGIRNISTVLALFVNFIRMWVDIGGDHYGETKWVSKVGKEARENGINIKGPYKFHETAEKLLKPEEENKPGEKNEVYFDDEMEIRDNGDYSIKGWKEAFKNYSIAHGRGPKNTIGGSSYIVARNRQAKKRLQATDV